MALITFLDLLQQRNRLAFLQFSASASYIVDFVPTHLFAIELIYSEQPQPSLAQVRGIERCVAAFSCH
jgi:hypothetical protein